MRRELDATTAELTRQQTRVQEITQEQARIRQNMQVLAQNSELYARYVKILTDQETNWRRSVNRSTRCATARRNRRKRWTITSRRSTCVKPTMGRAFLPDTIFHVPQVR